jgi:hypothetical protein
MKRHHHLTVSGNIIEQINLRMLDWDDKDAEDIASDVWNGSSDVVRNNTTKAEMKKKVKKVWNKGIKTRFSFKKPRNEATGTYMAKEVQQVNLPPIIKAFHDENELYIFRALGHFLTVKQSAAKQVSMKDAKKDTPTLKSKGLDIFVENKIHEPELFNGLLPTLTHLREKAKDYIQHDRHHEITEARIFLHLYDEDTTQTGMIPHTDDHIDLAMCIALLDDFAEPGSLYVCSNYEGDNLLRVHLREGTGTIIQPGVFHGVEATEGPRTIARFSLNIFYIHIAKGNALSLVLQPLKIKSTVFIKGGDIVMVKYGSEEWPAEVVERVKGNVVVLFSIYGNKNWILEKDTVNLSRVRMAERIFKL